MAKSQAAIPSVLPPATPEDSYIRAAKDCFAGTISGFVQVLTGQPFDTVKVRLQTQSTTNPIYSNALDCVLKTKRNEGFGAFYKGTLTPLVGMGACVSIQFGVLEYMKRVFNKQNAGSPLTANQLFLAGAASGVANSVVSCPVEHIRTRLQVQTATEKLYAGPVDAIRKIYGSYGLSKGIYRGQMVTMVREGFGYGVYFMVYEYLVAKSMQSLNVRRNEIPTWRLMTYGALSGYALWISIYPVDVIKSKLQTDAFDPAKKMYNSSWDCAKKVFKAEGIKGFYRGFVPCILRAAPVNAATFVAFEATMNLIGR